MFVFVFGERRAMYVCSMWMTILNWPSRSPTTTSTTTTSYNENICHVRAWRSICSACGWQRTNKREGARESDHTQNNVQRSSENERATDNERANISSERVTIDRRLVDFCMRESQNEIPTINAMLFEHFGYARRVNETISQSTLNIYTKFLHFSQFSVFVFLISSLLFACVVSFFTQTFDYAVRTKHLYFWWLHFSVINLTLNPS